MEMFPKIMNERQMLCKKPWPIIRTSSFCRKCGIQAMRWTNLTNWQTKTASGQGISFCICQKHDVNIVGGSCAVKRQGKFWNTAYDFDRKGQLINEYDKVHLFGLMQEDRFIAPGNSESSFEIDGIKSSCVICYDIRFPEWERKLMSSGAKILFVSAQWPDVRIKQWEILLRARAIENQAFVVAANRVGDAPNDHFNGHSLIIDPFGEIIANGCSGQEEIVSAILDLSLVDKARGNIPVFKDRRLDLY